jgi:hypothetical protein
LVKLLPEERLVDDSRLIPQSVGEAMEVASFRDTAVISGILWCLAAREVQILTAPMSGAVTETRPRLLRILRTRTAMSASLAAVPTAPGVHQSLPENRWAGLAE